MAKIIERKGRAQRVDTLCEHMGGVDPSPDADLKDVLMMGSLRGLAAMFDFCPACGQKLHKKEPVTCKVCSACDTLADDIGGFTPLYCTGCGEKFKSRE